MDMKALKMRAEWAISGKHERASAIHAASLMFMRNLYPTLV